MRIGLFGRQKPAQTNKNQQQECSMKNAQQLHEEAGVLRLWATLVSVGIPIKEAAKITAKSIGGLFRTPLLAVAEYITDGAELWISLDCREVFSGFVTNFAGKATYDQAVSTGARLMMASRVLERKSRLMQTGAAQEQVNEVMFYILLGTLCGLGCPILPALKIAGDEYLLGSDADLLVNVVKDGGTITEAMEKISGKFTAWDRSYIDVGEQCGSLPEMCNLLAEMKEQALLMAATQPSERTQSNLFTAAQMMEYDLFATIVDAGLPMIRATKMVVGATGNNDGHPFDKMAEAVENGELPSEAMEKLSLPSFIVEMMKFGETNGNCEVMLKLIAGYIKWDVLGIEPAPLPMPVEA